MPHLVVQARGFNSGEWSKTSTRVGLTKYKSWRTAENFFVDYRGGGQQ